MDILYTAKARNDLTRIHWKTRNSLINYISRYRAAKSIRKTDLKPIGDTGYYKLSFSDYVAVSKLDNDFLNILTVLEKKKFKLPEK